jgi:hypothetical protein
MARVPPLIGDFSAKYFGSKIARKDPAASLFDFCSDALLGALDYFAFDHKTVGAQSKRIPLPGDDTKAFLWFRFEQGCGDSACMWPERAQTMRGALYHSAAQRV